MPTHTLPPYILLETNWKGEDRGHDWFISGGAYEDEDGTKVSTAVCIVTGNETSFPVCRKTAEFIVRACNSHADLLAACEELFGRAVADGWNYEASKNRIGMAGIRAIIAKAKSAT